jgi:alkyl hydroperoxide reductase subunit AhpC
VATLLLYSYDISGAAHSAGTVQQTLTSPSLCAWLRGGWAILFSHPDDFCPYDLEMDRWLIVTQRAFAERDIRPIALASPSLDPERSWVTQVTGDSRTVLLEDPTQQHFGPVDLQTPVLRETIEKSGRRFVMIIDSGLRRQKVFQYDRLSELPSPLEILGWAEALRRSAALQVCTPERQRVVASSSPQIRERKRGSSREQAGRGAGTNGNRSAPWREMNLS